MTEEKIKQIIKKEDKVESPKSGILGRLKKVGRKARKEVIYGVYDNKGASIMVRLNDFFVDHSKVKIKEKSYFFHMLAVMVDAGIPVVHALKALSSRTKNERFSRVLNTVAYNSERGSTLSDSMSRYTDVFDEVEIGVIKSGEAVGQLGPMLFKLSDQVGRAHELRMKLWSASFYPLAVLGTLIVVAAAMLIWVFPTLLNLLNDGGIAFKDLPLATKLIIYLHKGLIEYWWVATAVILVFYGLFKFYTGTNSGATNWDYFKLRFPVVGLLLRRVYVLQFVTLIGVLIEAGLPVIQALEITSNAIPNRVFRLKIRDIIETVRKGGKISDSAADSEFLFPPEVIEMIRVGEKTAALGQVSEKVSKQYSTEIDHNLRRLTSVFEPVMILIVGLFVAILALAVMAPIFNLSSSIS
jgi:type IV pilus assembly protein PilC